MQMPDGIERRLVQAVFYHTGLESHEREDVPEDCIMQIIRARHNSPGQGHPIQRPTRKNQSKYGLERESLTKAFPDFMIHEITQARIALSKINSLKRDERQPNPTFKTKRCICDSSLMNIMNITWNKRNL